MERTEEFMQKIEPHLTSGDYFVQEYVLDLLSEEPTVPAEWSERLVHKALNSKDTRGMILIRLAGMELSDHALDKLASGVKLFDIQERTYVSRVVKYIKPKQAWAHRGAFEALLDKEAWNLYEALQTDDAETLWEIYRELLEKLEALTSYNQNLFFLGKQVVQVLVEKGLYTAEKAREIFNEQERQEWFDFSGILAVFALGLLGVDEEIPALASLLVRDEDILLEEVSAALVRFQSEAVLEAVEPYIKKEESSVFALSIFGHLKSQRAVDTLVKMYRVVQGDDKDMVLDALCSQLAPDAVPVITDFLGHGRQSIVSEINRVAYSFFHVMGLTHPNMEEWYRLAYEKEQSYRKNSGRPMPKSLKAPIPRAGMTGGHGALGVAGSIAGSSAASGWDAVATLTVKKVGRNDPCPCGSGKKYKKCCMNKQ